MDAPQTTDRCCQQVKPPEGRIAAGAAGASLLELDVTVGEKGHACVALVDSGASHCFLSERVARLAGLVLDTSH